MNDKPQEFTNPGEARARNGMDATISAMGAAMANREAVLKSLAESRDQVFKLLEERREEALRPMMRAKELLRQAQASTVTKSASGAVIIDQDPIRDAEATATDTRLRICQSLTQAFTVLSALQGAGGTAADAARKQAVVGIADALAELVEEEVDRILRC